MPVLEVVFFACWNRNCQPIFLRRQWTGCIRRYRAGRAVGAIEIEDHLPVLYRVSIKEPAARVCLRLTRQIAQNETQTFRPITTESSNSQLLTIEFEVNLTNNRSRSDIAEHVGNVHRLFPVGRHERSAHAIAHVQGKEHWASIVAGSFAIQVFDADS